MPKIRIEPYWPPRPSIRELMEGRPAGADDGGIPLKGYLGRPPKSAYRTKDRTEAERRGRAREIQPWRGEDQRRAHGAGEQQQEGERATGEGKGRGGERREGRGERDAREGRPPGMAGDCQGARPRRAKGQETSTEGNRDPMTNAVLTCVHAGRRVPQGRMHCEAGGERQTKKPIKTKSTAGGRTAQSG